MCREAWVDGELRHALDHRYFNGALARPPAVHLPFMLNVGRWVLGQYRGDKLAVPGRYHLLMQIKTKRLDDART